MDKRQVKRPLTTNTAAVRSPTVTAPTTSAAAASDAPAAPQSNVPELVLRRGHSDMAVHIMKLVCPRPRDLNAMPSPLVLSRRRPASVLGLSLAAQAAALEQSYASAHYRRFRKENISASAVGAASGAQQQPSSSVSPTDQNGAQQNASGNVGNAPEKNLIAPHSVAPTFRIKNYKRRAREVTAIDEEIRKTRQEESIPWLLTAGSPALREASEDQAEIKKRSRENELEVYQGQLESQQSEYVIFMRDPDGRNFQVLPVKNWYRFTEIIQTEQLTLQQIEEFESLRTRLRARTKGFAWLVRKFTSGDHEDDDDDSNDNEIKDTDLNSSPAAKRFKEGDVKVESDNQKDSSRVKFSDSNISGKASDDTAKNQMEFLDKLFAVKPKTNGMPKNIKSEKISYDDDDDDEEEEDDDDDDDDVFGLKKSASSGLSLQRKHAARLALSGSRALEKASIEELDFDIADEFQDDEEDHVYGDFSEEQEGRKKVFLRQMAVGRRGNAASSDFNSSVNRRKRTSRAVAHKEHFSFGNFGDNSESDYDDESDLENDAGLGRQVSLAASRPASSQGQPRDPEQQSLINMVPDVSDKNSKLTEMGRNIQRTLKTTERELYESDDEDNGFQDDSDYEYDAAYYQTGDNDNQEA